MSKILKVIAFLSILLFSFNHFIKKSLLKEPFEKPKNWITATLTDRTNEVMALSFLEGGYVTILGQATLLAFSDSLDN